MEFEKAFPQERPRTARGSSDSKSFYRFGLLLKAARLQAGYASPQEFSEAIDGKTGVQVSQRSIYRYEKGQSIPRTELFLAVGRTLSFSVFSELLGVAFDDQARDSQSNFASFMRSLSNNEDFLFTENPEQYQLQLAFEE